MDESEARKAMDAELRRAVDERMRQLVSGGNLVEQTRKVVAENLRLKHDLDMMSGMLERAYAVMERVASHPEFAEIMGGPENGLAGRAGGV